MTLPELAACDEASTQRDHGALFVLNDSGGKDSQAMAILVGRLIPRAQLVVMHADLHEVEWPGAREAAEAHAAALGVPFVVARAPKGFEQLVEHRATLGVPAFPSASNRQCTSDLKRDPLMREARRLARERGVSKIVTCMGLRAAESARRAKAQPWSRSKRGSVAGREWFEWLPIHHLATAEVFDTIHGAGQRAHPAYYAGNVRLSCVFCVLGSAGDARNGALHNPDLYARMVALEARVGYTAHQSRKSLVELTGLTVEQAFAQRRSLPVIQGGATC